MLVNQLFMRKKKDACILGIHTFVDRRKKRNIWEGNLELVFRQKVIKKTE